MKLLAFVVRDEKSEAFAHPFFTTSNGLAVRTFGDWCADKNTPLGKHPEDYSLFRVGSFDDELAQFSNEVAPVLMSTGNEVLNAVIEERRRQNPINVMRDAGRGPVV